MLRKYIITATTISIVLFSSCKKSFVEQTNPNAVSVEKNFQTENDITLAVNGVYQSLRSSNCIGEGSQLWTDDRSDDVNTTDNQSNNGEPFQFTAFRWWPVILTCRAIGPRYTRRSPGPTWCFLK